jgi:hypothetical protein
MPRRPCAAGTGLMYRGAVALAVAAALAFGMAPVVASAHPFVAGGGRIPVQSLALIELDLAHGCGDEQAGAGADTDEVALEAPPWLRVIDVPAADGWDIEVVRGEAPDTSIVVWTATSGAEPAPRFALQVVVDGIPGETRHLRVSQRCGTRIERWIGTPEAPADRPAVVLRLIAPDPDAPPPPPPEEPPSVAQLPADPSSEESPSEARPDPDPAADGRSEGAGRTHSLTGVTIGPVLVLAVAAMAIARLRRRAPPVA